MDPWTTSVFLQQTHVDAVEVDAPVGSGPRGNEAVAVFARGRHGGAGWRQSAGRSFSFLHESRGQDLSGRKPPDRDLTAEDLVADGAFVPGVNNRRRRSQERVTWQLRSCFHSTHVTRSMEGDPAVVLPTHNVSPPPHLRGKAAFSPDYGKTYRHRKVLICRCESPCTGAGGVYRDPLYPSCVHV